MDFDLSGQVVAITGASSGIGEATALACAQAGASVALAARRSERIEALADRIGTDRAWAFTADVGEEDQARAFVDGAAAHFGRLDHLVNNAGLMLLGPITGADTDEWRRMVHVNVFGVLYGSHAAIGHLPEGGTIVNVSSVAGRVARLGSGVYNLTKWGVGAFSESLRQELAPRGIRVTLIEPGAVATELQSPNNAVVQEQLRQRFADATPLDADDIARAILYVIGQPANVAINEVLVRPSRQQG
jgi:clavulanate-9-aldehyde reducatase